MINPFSSHNLSTQTGVAKVKADYDNKNAGIGGLDNAVSWSTSGTSGGTSGANSSANTDSPAPSTPPSAPKDFSALEATDEVPERTHRLKRQTTALATATREQHHSLEHPPSLTQHRLRIAKQRCETLREVQRTPSLEA